jgi:hypothetical protein
MHMHPGAAFIKPIIVYINYKWMSDEKAIVASVATILMDLKHMANIVHDSKPSRRSSHPIRDKEHTSVFMVVLVENIDHSQESIVEACA